MAGELIRPFRTAHTLRNMDCFFQLKFPNITEIIVNNGKILYINFVILSVSEVAKVGM